MQVGKPEVNWVKLSASMEQLKPILISVLESANLIKMRNIHASDVFCI